MQPYLRPTAPIAPDVVLTADPGLAMALAQRLMVKPLMANHHHGLWGYSGRTEAGLDLTVQAGGIGAPSTAAVTTELVGHGARRLIRVGTCAALDSSLTAGEQVAVESALGADGTSAALGAELTRPDPELLVEGPRPIDIASHDLGAAAGQAAREAWIAAAIAAVDLESAALFAVAERLGLAAGAALVVTEAVTGGSADEDALREALLQLGETAAQALPADERQSAHAMGG